MKRLKIASISILILGLVSTVIALAIRTNSSPDYVESQGKDLKIRYIITQQLPNSPLQVNANRYRLQKADGSWKEVTTYLKPNGSVDYVNLTYGINGRGVFSVSETRKQLIFIAEKGVNNPVPTEQALRNSPQFGGEEPVAGVRTLISNITYGKDSGQMNVAPEIGFVLLKTVSTSSRSQNVMEAVEVKIEPITEQEFGSIPDYPINYESYKKKIGAVESTGRKDQADIMRQIIPPDQR